MSARSQQVVNLVIGGLLGLVLLSGRSGAIAPEPQLEGWVRLASGQPAAGVQVRLFDLTDPRHSVGTTANEEGYFALAAPRSADAQPQGFALSVLREQRSLPSLRRDQRNPSRPTG